MQGIDMKKTGQRIKEICRSKKVSVKDIQKNLMIGSFQAIYAWFSGKSLPSLDNLYRLSRLLGVPMDFLVVGQAEQRFKPLEHYEVWNKYEVPVMYEAGCKQMPERIFAYYKKWAEKAAC